MGGCISLGVLRVDEQKGGDGDIPSSFRLSVYVTKGVYVCSIGMNR